MKELVLLPCDSEYGFAKFSGTILRAPVGEDILKDYKCHMRAVEKNMYEFIFSENKMEMPWYVGSDEESAVAAFIKSENEP